VIPLELRTEIRRLYYAEHWKVGTIASSLHVHHDTVRLAIAAETLGARRGVCRPTALDPYLAFIRDTLAQYARLRATRLHEMLRLRGYTGSATQVRRLVRQIRPQSVGVYRRLETLSGEEAQIDWGSFGTIRLGRGTRAVSGFVMVLSYSRAMHALFTLDQSLESFLRGHVAAFEALSGAARTLVYDYVARHIIVLLCPRQICGRREANAGSAVLPARRRPHNGLERREPFQQRVVVAPNGRSAGWIGTSHRGLAEPDGRLLHTRVDLRIPVGRLQTHVAEPSTDDIDVNASLEQMNGCRMPKHVRADRAAVWGGPLDSERVRVAADDLVETEAREGTPT
jgi:transposase